MPAKENDSSSSSSSDGKKSTGKGTQSVKEAVPASFGVGPGAFTGFPPGTLPPGTVVHGALPPGAALPPGTTFYTGGQVPVGYPGMMPGAYPAHGAGGSLKEGNQELPKPPDMPLLMFKFKPPQLSFMTGMFLGINVGMVLLGILMFSFGTWLMSDTTALATIFQMEGNVEGVHSETINDIGITMIIMGLLIASVGTFGGCGCVQSHPRCLFLYSRLMIGLIGMEVLGIIILIFVKNSLIDKFFIESQAKMETEYDGKTKSTELFTHLADMFMRNMECCGPLGVNDFQNTVNFYCAINYDQLAKIGETGDPSGSNASTPDDKIPDACEQSKPKEIQVIIESAGSLTDKDKQGILDSRNMSCEGKGTVKPADRLWKFPPSCCKREPITGKMDEPSCLCKEPGATNKHTLISCKDATVSFIGDQLFLIVGVLATFFSVEISAVTNAMAIAKKIEKEEAKRILMEQMASGPDKALTMSLHSLPLGAAPGAVPMGYGHPAYGQPAYGHPGYMPFHQGVMPGPGPGPQYASGMPLQAIQSSGTDTPIGSAGSRGSVASAGSAASAASASSAT